MHTHTQYKDLLQLMIDATGEEKDGKRKLTDEEIIDHAITFMLAGYDTTANALSYTTYLLALHPDTQDKLQAEIDTHYKEHPVMVAHTQRCSQSVMCCGTFRTALSTRLLKTWSTWIWCCRSP